MLDAILVFVPVGVLLWARYILPIGIAGGIVCMIGRGVWYLLRKDLHNALDHHEETIGNQAQQLAWLYREREQVREKMVQLKTDRQHLEREHERALERVRRNGSNTGLFKGYTGPLNAQPQVSAKSPPPLPVEKHRVPQPPPLKRNQVIPKIAPPLPPRRAPVTPPRPLARV
jgi:hypothetical protein